MAPWRWSPNCGRVVSALRETSVISAALIAVVWFHEPFGWRRLPPATAVVAGVVLLNL